MAGMCRYDAHVTLASWLSGSPVEVPTCPKRAEHVAVVELKPVSGLTLRFDTEVCDEHETYISSAPHCTRSIGLRLPT